MTACEPAKTSYDQSNSYECRDEKSPASPFSIFLFWHNLPVVRTGARATRHGARPSSLTLNLLTMPPTLELQIERAGDGKNYPKKGDNVCVHYTMRLSSGREVDNSYKRKTPFRFRVASGQVVKGWDQAVTQLSVGEKATTTFPANLAFGRTGLPGLIPPNQDLNVTLELVSIETDADVEAMLTGDDSFAVVE